MEVFRHHLYEYSKGLRNLILHTTRRYFQEHIITKLEREGIAYVIYPVGVDRINVFFGADSCINVVRSIGKADLSTYNDEEDFILGIMLGYDRLKQCERYIKRKSCVVPLEVPIG